MRFKEHHIRLAQTDLGVKEMIGDYSENPEKFKYGPTGSRRLAVHRVLISIVNNDVRNYSTYGGIDYLKNGLSIVLKNRSGQVIDRLTGFQIHTAGHWAAHCFDGHKHEGRGDIPDYLVFRYSFDKSGYPVILRGRRGEYLCLKANDNFTGLISHKFLFEGYYL